MRPARQLGVTPNTDGREVLLFCFQPAGLRVDLRIVALVAAVAFSIVPMLAVEHLPFVDYPNHLARYQILHSLSASPILQRFYEWHWAFIPNLAQDLIVIPLAKILPIEVAGNIATTAALVMIYLGTALVDYQLNGRRWGLSIFAGIFLYSGALRLGFVNYITGVGFALLLFAAWLRYRPLAATPIGFLGFCFAGVFLLLMHLFAFGLYAVCVASYELTILWEKYRSQGRAALADYRLPVCGLFALLLPCTALLFSPTSTDALHIGWSTFLWKAEALTAPIFFSRPFLELPLLLLLGLLMVAGFGTGWIKIHPRMMLATVAFAVLFIAMPRTLFGSSYADYRLLCGAVFFFLAGLHLEAGRSSQAGAVYSALAVLLVFRVGTLLVEWVPEQAILGEYDGAFAQLPRGSRVLVLAGSTGSASSDRRPPLDHVPVFAAAKHEDFVAYTFSGAAVPLSYTAAFRDYAPEIFAPYPEYASEMARYDFVLAVRRPRFAVPATVRLEGVGRGVTYELYRVVRAPK